MTDAPPEQAWFAKADEDLEMGHAPALRRPAIHVGRAEEPRHLRARGDRDHAGYVLDTFPIIPGNDQAQFDDRYRTRDISIGIYPNALTAGDIDTVVDV